ncbi:hypothetical protein [Shewanella atlantica]|uniref:Uncharacterized protein n=1 Tax=Shewanella atlantica TaxID=271099 RepID=A0A3S0JTB6_9GAMM|nr:hypothetical protein [Shewanella atlantica]RTR28539.1 hypothetical protein EKG39_18525 [Shewanella atlantica]
MKNLNRRVKKSEGRKSGFIEIMRISLAFLIVPAGAGALLGLATGLAFASTAVAGFDEKVAASFAAKYQVCALKLKDTPGYRLKALGLKAKSDEIGRDKLGGGGYIKAFQKEKKKAWLLSKKECKKFADRL